MTNIFRELYDQTPILWLRHYFLVLTGKSKVYPLIQCKPGEYSYDFWIPGKTRLPGMWAVNSLKTKERLYECPKDTQMKDLLVAAGLFESKSQAVKAGWNKEIPVGVNIYLIGKRKTEVCIFKNPQ